MRIVGLVQEVVIDGLPRLYAGLRRHMAPAVVFCTIPT
jgi:hypothetical protein